MSSANILIGGDLCPVNRYQPLFTAGNRDAILGPFATRAQQADLFVANLECPLIHKPSPILKTGPVLGVPVSSARGLQAMGIHAVGIANNHILDHGFPGLASTMEACSAMGITTFGAGPTLTEARGIPILEVKGIRIGLLAMAEREWSIATRTTPGANPLDPIGFVRQMKDLRGGMDYLVVLLHAGCEGCEVPSPGLRKVCQFLVEEGANVVAVQHSHCVGCYETYQGQLIVYGQGNFIFDYDSHGYKGKEGILISLEINEKGEATFELLPFTQGTARAGLMKMAPGEESTFREALESRSALLSQEASLEAAWEAYCQTRKLAVLNEVLDHGRILRRLNRNGAILRLRGRSYAKNLLSIVQNESIVEMLNTLLRPMLK
ncbi:MAG: CapA family protein [Geothrix sp.]|nr:CapA family protein [Geothrix sp.]